MEFEDAGGAEAQEDSAAMADVVQHPPIGEIAAAALADRDG